MRAEMTNISLSSDPASRPLCIPDVFVMCFTLLLLVRDDF